MIIDVFNKEPSSISLYNTEHIMTPNFLSLYHGPPARYSSILLRCYLGGVSAKITSNKPIPDCYCDRGLRKEYFLKGYHSTKEWEDL